MKNSIVKFVMAALIAISATYAGISAGAAGNMNGTGPMTGMGDMSGGGGGGYQQPAPPHQAEVTARLIRW